jgi:hypothetical protein
MVCLLESKMKLSCAATPAALGAGIDKEMDPKDGKGMDGKGILLTLHY